jgi:hypothetical protein
MVAPTCFGITLPSSGSVPSALWEMLSCFCWFFKHILTNCTIKEAKSPVKISPGSVARRNLISALKSWDDSYILSQQTIPCPVIVSTPQKAFFQAYVYGLEIMRHVGFNITFTLTTFSQVILVVTMSRIDSVYLHCKVMVTDPRLHFLVLVKWKAWHDGGVCWIWTGIQVSNVVIFS